MEVKWLSEAKVKKHHKECNELLAIFTSIITNTYKNRMNK